MTRPVVWSRDAVDELKGIARYIAKDDPRSARRVAAAIREAGAKLGLRSTGRRGRVDGTLEKSLAPLPYIIAYAVKRDDGGEAIVILRVIHTPATGRPEAGHLECAEEIARRSEEQTVSEPTQFEESSGNVFADLELPNADEHLLKVHLVYKIMTAMNERGLTQSEVAAVIGVRQPEVSNMLRGRFERVSVEKLLRRLLALGHDVEIVVRPQVDPARAPQLRMA